MFHQTTAPECKSPSVQGTQKAPSCCGFSTGHQKPEFKGQGLWSKHGVEGKLRGDWQGRVGKRTQWSCTPQLSSSLPLESTTGLKVLLQKVTA